MKNTIHSKKAWRPAQIYKNINRIRNLKKKNLIRGLSSKSSINYGDIASIRSGNTPYDSEIIGSIIKGPWGLHTGAAAEEKKTSEDLYTMTGFPTIDWKSEIAYTAGYINAMENQAIDFLSQIKALAPLEYLPSEEILNSLLNISKIHGASNYLSYKLAYVRSARNLSTAQLSTVSEIESEIQHRENAGLHFSALENLSSKISLFTIAQRRVSGLVAKVDGDFRKAISLSNFIPTPLDEEDVAGFLLRASESCLLDTVYAIVIIFNLSSKFSAAHAEFKKHLSSRFFKELLHLVCPEQPASH